VVDHDRAYAEVAGAFLAEGEARDEKTVTFGSRDSPVQQQLRQVAATAADPYVDVLGCGDLEPERMFAMFRLEATKALDEGYDRLRVAAAMDWLLPAVRGRDQALGFEVLLDRVVAEVDATVLCGYRRTSFSPDTILGVLCTHPVSVGDGGRAPFQLVAGDGGCWALSGEVDVACSHLLAAALTATADERWMVDVSGLAFIDVSGMRALAMVARDAGRTMHVRGLRLVGALLAACRIRPPRRTHRLRHLTESEPARHSGPGYARGATVLRQSVRRTTTRATSSSTLSSPRPSATIRVHAVSALSPAAKTCRTRSSRSTTVPPWSLEPLRRSTSPSV
jgi:hypothetical protein